VGGEKLLEGQKHGLRHLEPNSEKRAKDQRGQGKKKVKGHQSKITRRDDDGKK